jgi:hypothetical protein
VVYLTILFYVSKVLMMELVGKWSEHPKFFLKMVCMLGVGGDYENSFCRIWSISKISLMRITYTAVTVADNHARKPDTPETDFYKAFCPLTYLL